MDVTFTCLAFIDLVEIVPKKFLKENFTRNLDEYMIKYCFNSIFNHNNIFICISMS